MKHSRRAKRMGAHHKRNNKPAGLNMISLMDIFTILVFFLLVNSSEVQTLPSTKSLTLPESVAEKKPNETVVILVNDKEILVQGRSVVLLAEVEKQSGLVISRLEEELKQQLAKKPPVASVDGEPVRNEVTIMGNKTIPYALLKKIMATCSKANFNDISLAVMQKQQEQG